VAIRGSDVLLLEGPSTPPLGAGDVVGFAEGDVHGFGNTGSVEFVYLSVTSPPIDFRPADAAEWAKGSGDPA